MLILGRNTEDKGNQLEALTHHLLQELGHRNCTTGVISSGGSELDVTAEYSIPHLASPINKKTICECKAHRNPVGMTDWQKFLGKVLSESVIVGHEVMGCFIALSGVNGNVKGHFDQIHSKRPDITLIDGDDLLDHVCKSFSLIGLKEVTEIVRRTTIRPVTQLEPAYYEKVLYWAVVFNDNYYALLDSHGTPLNEEQVAQLHPMMKREMSVSEYLDLRKEAEAIVRFKGAKAACIGKLMLDGGKSTLDQKLYEFDENELKDAADDLVRDGLLTHEGGTYRIPVVGGTVAPALYRRMLGNGVPGEVLGCDFYDAHINRAFVENICETQKGVVLGDSDIELAVRLLQMSPSAIVRCAEPLDMIVTHRGTEQDDSIMDAMDRDYLLKTMVESLQRDFEDRQLSHYFYTVRHLREFELSRQVRLKTEEGMVLAHDFSERRGIGQMTADEGGQFVHILMRPDAPQPWEMEHVKNRRAADPGNTE